jgi:hypothetical protein
MAYELYKPETPAVYYLGGIADWRIVFPSDNKFQLKHFYRNPKDLYIALLEKVAYKYPSGTTLEYFSSLAEDIFRWGGDDYIQIRKIRKRGVQ